MSFYILEKYFENILTFGIYLQAGLALTAVVCSCSSPPSGATDRPTPLGSVMESIEGRAGFVADPGYHQMEEASMMIWMREVG